MRYFNLSAQSLSTVLLDHFQLTTKYLCVPFTFNYNCILKSDTFLILQSSFYEQRFYRKVKLLKLVQFTCELLIQQQSMAKSCFPSVLLMLGDCAIMMLIVFDIDDRMPRDCCAQSNSLVTFGQAQRAHLSLYLFHQKPLAWQPFVGNRISIFLCV